MEKETLKVIADKALSLTRQDKLKWDVAKNSSDFFTTNVGEQEISMFNTGLRYVFQVADASKNLLGSLTESTYIPSPGKGIPGLENINQLGLPIVGSTEISQLLRDLYEQAKKSALQVDKNLDYLLNTLNGM
jgi:hypothetical protein